MRPLPLIAALCFSFMSTLKAGDSLTYSILSEQGAKRIVTFYRRPPTDVTDYWTPTGDEVAVAEAQMAKFFAGTPRLSKQAPSDYFRQYGGIIVGGERRLYICFILRAVVSVTPDTIREPIIVHDGGASFWRVDFDPRTRTFSQMQSNGTAE